MTVIASQLGSASRPRSSSHLLERLVSILDTVALVLLPSIAALLLSAALVGHGEISTQSVVKVLNAMAQTTTAIAAP